MRKKNLAIPDFPNVSLVAFYGEKAPELKTLIQKLQTYLTEHKLIDSFKPYELEQVHGTIIGCEGICTKSGVVNKWYREHRQETRYIDISGLINYLQHQVSFPLNISFGGYDLNLDYNFLSRNQHPYLRSFQLQSTEDQTIPVLIGWPWQNNKISWDIDDLRKDLQLFNLLHKYHGKSDDIDNDFYLRLGTIESQITMEVAQIITRDIRDLLASQSALSIPICLEDLVFAQYQDLSLSLDKTNIISTIKITPSQLEEFYTQSFNTM